MLNVRMVGDRALIARFEQMPSKLRDALYRKCVIFSLKLEAKVKQKLSGPVLNVVTGALRRSIKSKTTKGQDSVEGRVFSTGDVKYAGIHEFGGTTKPHIIEPKKKQALAFMMGGKQVFAKRVNHPGSKMPERSFLRSSLAEMESEIKAGFREAVIQAARGN